MNTVSGSSSYSATSATSKGISGLMSGMDTEAMVEKMLSGTQSKIDKQNANKQTTIWKQLMYRDVISQITSFQTSFFKGSASNLMNSAFYNAMSAITKSTAIKVSASSTAPTGRTEIKVDQLATNSKLQSGDAVSGTLAGEIDVNALQRRVVFEVDGTNVQVDLTKVDPTDPDSVQKLVDQLNSNADFSGAGLTASKNSAGQLVLDSGTKELRVSSRSTTLGLETLGLHAGAKTAKASDSATSHTLTTTTDASAAATLRVSYNGVAQSVTLEGATAQEIRENLQKSLTKAFGTTSGGDPVIKVEGSGNEFKLTTIGAGNEVSLDSGAVALGALGLEAGTSNKIVMGQKLRYTNFNDKLEGDSFSFTINGETFSFTGENTLSDVVKKINGNSAAGVRITYSDLEDKFTIESTAAGAGRDIKMEQTSGNLLSAMFGNVVDADGNSILSTGKTTVGNGLVKNNVGHDDAMSTIGGDLFTSGVFSLTVNGKAVSISIPAKAEKDADGKAVPYTKAELIEAVNQGLADQFGYVKDNDDVYLNNPQAISLDASGNLVVKNGAKVSFAANDNLYTTDADGNKVLDADLVKKAAQYDAAVALGFSKVDNVIADDTTATPPATPAPSTTLGDIGINELVINGTTLSGIGTGTTLKDAVAAIEAELGSDYKVAFSDGRFGITYTGTAAAGTTVTIGGTAADGGSVGEKLFGAESIAFGQAATGAEAKLVAGQNAKVTINGVATERSSNSFTVNGLNIELKETTPPGETITIDTTRDTDKIYEGVKSFVEGYNKMVENLNKLIDAEATYKDYAPLTAAQKKDMSESEIKLWEEKAKTGLLRNDSDINSMLSRLRLALYNKPEGSEYALYDIGIETSNDWKDKGKLVIDEGKLKQMIETNPQAIQSLFTSTENGIAGAMNAALEDTVGATGTLTQLAGIEGRASSVSNTLTTRLIDINDKIKELQSRYETEKARYWKQFNTMEQALSNMNTQASWLTQQMGG